MPLPIMKRYATVSANDSKRKRTDVFSGSPNTTNFIDCDQGDTAESTSGFFRFTFHSSQEFPLFGYWPWRTIHENPNIGFVAQRTPVVERGDSREKIKPSARDHDSIHPHPEPTLRL